VRCKLTPDTRGGAAAAAAGEVTMSDTKKNPLTREQFQLLESIGFGTSAKRKKYDRSVLDRKWEEKLYVIPSLFGCWIIFNVCGFTIVLSTKLSPQNFHFSQELVRL
jgi:hypothetical protein